MDAATGRLSEQSPDLFRALADNLPQLAWIAAADGDIFWYNQRWYEYSGTTFEEMRGWGWRSIHHPDHIARVEERFRQALAEGQAWEDTFPLRGADGRYRTFLSRAQPLRDERGRITHWFGTNTDVTERVAAEKRASFLVRLGEVLRRAKSAPAALEAACELLLHELGASRVIYAEADIAGGSLEVVSEYLAPEVPSVRGRHPVPKAVFERLPLGQPYVTSDWLAEPALASAAARPDSAALPVRAIMDLPHLRNGQLVGWLSVHQVLPREWTAEEVALAQASAERTWSTVEQARAEEQLRLSENQFRGTAEALPGLLFVTNAAGENIYVNPFYERYTGRHGDGLGDWWREAIHPDDLDDVLEATARSLGEGIDLRATYRIRRADGEYRWHSTIASPSRDGEGKIVRWIGVALDIHDTLEAEARARAAAEELEAVYATAPVGLTVLDHELRYVRINDRLAEINGVAAADHIGRTVREIVPDLADKAEAALRRVLDGEEAWGIELSGETPAQPGVLRTWRENWLPIRSSAGEITGIAISAEEITRDKEEEARRRKAEAALKVKEERYRALFESMEQGFCTIQVDFEEGRPYDYRFTELNPAFTRHTGLEQSVLHRSVREVVPNLEQSWFNRYGEVAATGQSQRFVDYAEPLGRWFEVYAFRIGEPADHSVALLFSDVSERIRQEEALRDSEREMRLRLNAIPQMVWSTRADGYHDFYNDRWYEFTGTPLGSTDGEGWNGMFHPDDQARAFERWRHSLSTGEPYEIEYRLRHHDGSYRWVLGRALPARDSTGAIVRWMGTCTDIDDRIAAERALQDSEARLRAIIRSLPVGLMFADASGTITGSNDVILEFLAHDMKTSREVADYSADYVAFHEDGRQVESHEYPLARALGGEERPSLECAVQRGDGGRKWLRYVAAPIRSAEGTIVGGVVASIDIDREKRLTLSLEKEVERVVAEREAAQEALRQSQKLEAMGQLTGGVAHDFNNLLTPIIGSLDLLQRKQVLDERTGRLVDGALASAEKARMLVQRLLAFARRQPLQPQSVDLGRIVTEMSELIASTSGPRVKVEVSVPPELPPALADGNQLEMALLNLSVNARDAMPDGGTLTIAVRREAAEAGRRLGLADAPHLVLAVSDSGVGMDEETRRRAIEPFFSTKGIGKGTGLGLSMVHGLAAQLGGALDIRSAPGVGTSIELWLPIASSNLADTPPDGEDAEGQGAGTILLVDDEELVRASTAGMLADLGYRVVEAASGEEALRRVEEGLRPDLLVTDQLMPGLSGTDLAVRLREMSPALRVLVVSGYADLDSLSPVFPHLSKPFRQAELGAALERATSSAD